MHYLVHSIKETVYPQCCVHSQRQELVRFALLRFLSVLVLVCHWLACVWALTLQLVDQGFPQWIDDVDAH